MRTFPSVWLCIFIGISANAQKKDPAFLQQYKFRTPGYSSVVLTANANGGLSGGNGSGSPQYLTISPRLEATRIISTDNVLATFNSSVTAGFDYSKYTLATGSQHRTNFNYTLSQSLNQKKYKGYRYFQTGYSGQLKQALYSATNNYIKKDNAAFSNVSYTIGVGRGRIENVTDAQMADNILLDLKKNNLLTRDFTADEINGLARTITGINTTRLFDFRRKHIFELKQIDSFLSAKGLVKEKNIDYFTTVNDNWFYAFNPLRRHGKERFITLTPLLGIDDKKTIFNTLPADSSFRSFSKFAVVTLTLGIDNARAISLKRQFNKGLSLITSYGYSRDKQTSNTVINEFSASNIFSSLLGYLEWGYFPHTRTSIITTLTNNFQWGYQYSEFNNNTGLSFSGNYFISYDTRLFANVNSNFNTARNSVNDFRTTASASFGFGIQHYIR